MPLKRSIILQSIFAFCIICLIFIARQANDASSIPAGGYTDDCTDETCRQPPQPLESNNEVVLSPEDIIDDAAELDTDYKNNSENIINEDVDNGETAIGINPIIEENGGFPFTVVTAASSNHFCALESMLYTFQELKKYVAPEDFPRLVVYSLGIDEHQRAIAENLYTEGYFDELVDFNYDAYPAFWNVQINRGQYAWKPGIVKEMQIKYGGVVVWLDTGDVPNALFMRMIPQYIRRHGFWSPRSTGLISSKFNHAGMFNYFKLRRKDFEMFENCNGAAVGFDADNQQVVDELITPWYDCAIEENCIAPPSSSRQNHRQDQSAITLLAIRAGYRCFEYPEFHGLTIHQDEYCHQRLLVLEDSGLLLHPSTIDV
ncbi:hypothetical protein BDB00DRAFT_454446 [Zychaea mexicana]|uniref:uncharacterized protein n=1 Tax=Zychaea mexicana TaxID=64656 RepID=UPI0022FE9168|nr:uncharacterized protein BDB00DRAFT_454446 [Zychaea mexicana]KAI9492159.1 hypothetical protein BDB00DRAFT_454446 [Zychaea mexicana]